MLHSRVRNTDPLTSWQAADQAKNLASQHFEVIVECLRRHGPCGKDGIAELIGLDGNQVARRLPELARIGIVELTGKTTKSKSGRAEREWRIKPLQLKLL
jgi:predicted ArsR family transcriptional regulator